MIRRFKFEGEIPEELDCVPMAVRRKLDRVGIKLGLDDWKEMGRGERLALCHLPTNLEEECETMRVFIREAVQRRGAAEPRTLSEAERRSAEPPEAAPETLVERAQALGFALGEAEWDKFDSDQRYALMKLGAGESASHDLAAALTEFLGAAPATVTIPEG